MPPTDDGTGGFHFPVAPGIFLRAGTEADLTKLIFEYRLRNNIPIGDIERDIDAYYCKRWPSACHPEPSDQIDTVKPAQRRAALIDRIALWASTTFRQMPKGGHELAPQAEAIARAQSCLGCPHNTAWRSGCAACNSSTNKLLLELRQMRKTPHDGNLLACNLLGHDNMTAVHLPPQSITEEQRRQLPDHCWRKST